MTIEKNSVWATETVWPSDGPRFSTDRELALAAAAALAAGTTLEAVITAGDLRQTLGGPRGEGAAPYRYPCDLGFASLDGGEEHPFVAHVVARRRFWRGETAVVMNAAYVGDRYLGPRSHPNDNLLDVTLGALPLQQRLLASKRSKQGTHLPHPLLAVSRRPTWEHTFARPIGVWADGAGLGRCHHLAVRLVTDALAVIA